MAGPSVQIIGRYALFDEIASGGMATVHIGRLAGEVGFSRTVAIKRLHPQLAKVPEFVSMLVDEARLAARIRHPNVVPTLDVVKTGDELFLVMEYVHGESLHHLLKQCRRTGMVLPARYVVPIIAGVLHGLHAAHEAKGEGGQPLEIVHRDVSPQNILVGTDGVARVFDFGIAKACGRLQVTRTGELKGKLPYMAPEQLSGGVVGRRADVYAAAVVLWEALAGRRLFRAEFEGELFAQVLGGAREPPSAIAPDVPKELDELVMRGLAMSPANRFASAREMAYALERTVPGASPAEIGEWVEREAGEVLALRAARIDEIESQPSIVTQAPDKPQRTLGAYELVAELHKSYLGPCWAARPSAADDPSEIVLIRRIHVQPDRARAGAQPAALQQLAAAAEAAMGWRHERLVPVLDTMQTEDELAIVSQYIEGETLRALTWMAGIRRAAIPPAVALRIAMELLEGLDFLHAERLADPRASSFVGLTADDVLVATDGHARLLEPGVAGVAATLEPWSRHPKRACYDAPEQLRDGALVDLRADLFTVGVLLWEMIQNRPLFSGSSLSEVYEGIVSGNIEQVQTSPVVHARGTVDALANVVARALERDETARYQSASEMLTAITKADQPIASPAQVAELLGRLAGSSLTAQRQRIDADPAAASEGRNSKGRAPAASETPVGASWASSHGSAPVSAAFAAPPSSLPFPTPPVGVTRPSVGQPSQRGPLVARASGLAAPPRGSAPGVQVHGLAGNTAPQLSEPPDALPTTVFDPEEGPTISGGANTGIRRVMPPAIGAPIPGSLADLSFPQQASRQRLVLMVVVASMVLGAVAAGVMHMLTPGGGGVDAASAPTAIGPARATEDETSAAAAPTADVESSAASPGSVASAPPRADKEHAHAGGAKGHATGTAPSAGPPASTKPPPQDQRYVPTHI